MTEPTADTPSSGFLDSLGTRGHRRAEPRTSVVVAGAGCALAVLGVLIVSGDTGASSDDFNRVPGIVLSALVVGAGFVTLANARTGPVAAAGSVAAALGVPPLMFFLTFDGGGFPPYSTEGILVVSTLVWIAAYVAGPGRGRPFFLGAGLIGLWFTLLQLTEKVFDAPFTFLPFLFFGGFTVEQSFESTGTAIGGDEMGGSDFGGSDFGGDLTPLGPSLDVPDPTMIALISLALGVGYLLLTRYLDRQGHHGTATPAALATIPTLLVGTVFMADELEQAGTGLLLTAVGLGLAHHGSTVARRATAWIGAAAAVVGAGVFLSDMTDDATIGGMLFIAAGIGLVALGHALATALGEPDEMEPTDLVGVRRGVTVTAPRAPGAPPDIPPPPGAPGYAQRDDDWAPPPDTPRET